MSDGTNTSVDTVSVTVNAADDAPPSDPVPAPFVDDPSPVDGKKSPDPALPPSEPASEVSEPMIDVSDLVTDSGAVEATELEGRDPVPSGASEDERRADSGASDWDGSEELDVMDPSEGLSQRIEIDGVESTRISQLLDIEHPDAIPHGGIDEEFEVVESLDLPLSQPTGNAVGPSFFGNDATGGAAPQVLVRPADGRADDPAFQNREDDNHDTIADRRSVGSDEAQRMREEPMSSSRSEESAVDSKAEEAGPLVTSRGFFAGLWVTVNGLLGTGSRTSGTDSQERTRRR